MIRRGDQSPAAYDALPNMLIRSWFSLNRAPEGALMCPHLSDAGDRYCQNECEEDLLLTASDLIETDLSTFCLLSFLF